MIHTHKTKAYLTSDELHNLFGKIYHSADKKYMQQIAEKAQKATEFETIDLINLLVVKLTHEMNLDNAELAAKAIKLTYEVVGQTIADVIPAFSIRCRENGDVIEYCDTIDEAKEMLQYYENEDKEAGIYEESFYEIYDNNIEEIVE